ncbi:MAG: imidazole glycerol phosphate synthase subunit HisH [Gammaproteobacteria bacterium]|nr:imidazole glycerol phosphate synthase subunit HisH [Gammaproteobacteria bacterium]
MSTIAVIDYGMGNLRSVCKALEHVAPDARVFLTSDPDALVRADRVVFPGQGAIGGCIAEIDRLGLRAAVLQVVDTKPFLGICLGLQALYEYSEEGGGTAGLGVLPGRVALFPRERMRDPGSGRVLKVPHMGWNQAQQVTAHPLWRGIAQDARFYFVHSYYAEAGNREQVMAVTEYGLRFTSAAGRENIFAVQFHPEKSQQSGLQLLENFASWDGTA